MIHKSHKQFDSNSTAANSVGAAPPAIVLDNAWTYLPSHEASQGLWSAAVITTNENLTIGRAGHSGLYVDTIDAVLIFGGFTGYDAVNGTPVMVNESSVFFMLKQSVESDLVLWKASPLHSAQMPSPRYFHAAAVSYLRGEAIMVIHGGFSRRHGDRQHSILNDCWLYYVARNEWVPAHLKSYSPALASHSMSAVGNKLVIFGGRNSSQSTVDCATALDSCTNGRIFQIDLNAPVLDMRELKPSCETGGSCQQQHLYGHSAAVVRDNILSECKRLCVHVGWLFCFI